MKIMGFILLLSSLPALSKPCKVYGISDSPQGLSCTFPQEEKILLTCRQGDYFLGEAKVLNAFHLDVETGSSPLVFKTQKNSLTLIKQKADFSAEWESSDNVLSGICL